MSEAFRFWLTQELDRRGWSHRELARQMETSQSFVSRIIKGENPAGINFCHRVAKVLDVPPEKLLRLAGILPGEPAVNESELGPVSREIMELIQGLPPEDRQQILDYVRFVYQQRRR
jgi:transcriptional regulator with XRE-family HTH domain